MLKHNFSQQLIASLCHEVMTPLNCIVNVSEILMMDSLRPSKYDLYGKAGRD